MVDEAGSSSTASLKDDKPVIVRVKRKSYQSPLEAFCEFSSSFALCGYVYRVDLHNDLSSKGRFL